LWRRHNRSVSRKRMPLRQTSQLRVTTRLIGSREASLLSTWLPKKMK